MVTIKVLLNIHINLNTSNIYFTEPNRIPFKNEFHGFATNLNFAGILYF